MRAGQEQRLPEPGTESASLDLMAFHGRRKKKKSPSNCLILFEPIYNFGIYNILW